MRLRELLMAAVETLSARTAGAAAAANGLSRRAG
jgi:hypothetical protein